MTEKEFDTLRQKIQRLEQRAEPNHITSFMDKLVRLQELRRAAVPVVQVRRQPAPPPVAKPKPDTHIYQKLAADSGYRLALMGFDFADQAELDHARESFADYLTRCGVDDASAEQEVRKLNHSWEFATYAFNPPSEQPTAYLQYGKGFMSHRASWNGVFDPTPDSTSVKLFAAYLETRERSQEPASDFNPYYEGT